MIFFKYFQLYEGLRQINLIADINDAANIQNCGEINEIDQNETFDHEEETNNENNDVADLDACASDPCENGGTCQVVNDMAVCTCSVGFAGKHCEDRKFYLKTKEGYDSLCFL